MSHPVDQLARRLFGPEATAIPFQRKVYDALAAGRSVVLQAPTGAGKTFAALAPLALGAWGAGNGEPATKLIYSLPLRVLAGSLRDQYRKLFSDNLSPDEAAFGSDLHFTTQYGGAAEDEFLDLKRGPDSVAERGVVFATIDQTLSGFLGVPLSLPSRLANVLYGSVLSGALVFDEVHLLDANKSFTTALHLLRRSPWPVLVMTATMSTKLRRNLADLLDAEEIVVGDDDLPRIKSQHETEKHVEVCKQSMDGRVLATCLGERTLVLCNTVDRAQEVYGDLRKTLAEQADAPEVMLLHSRFLPEHRASKERILQGWFDKESTGRYVLVSTQVVEAGLDISCDVMHTEASPADSFLQRIGRAARFEGQNEARIYVYPPVPKQKGDPYLPYKREPVEETLDALRLKRSLRYEDLQGLVDAVHEAEQESYVRNHEKGSANLAEEIYRVRHAVDRTANRALIRDVDNVEIVVATENEVLSRDVSPYAYPAVSLRRNTFRWRYLDTGVVRALAVREFTDESRQGHGDRYFTLDPVEPGQKLPPGRYVVSPEDAAYDADLGLRLGEAGDTSFPPPREVPMWTRYEYEEESYQEHIRRVFERGEVRPAALAAIRRLSALGKLPDPVQDPERLIELVVWAHDLAKLTDGWQAAHGDRDLTDDPKAEPLAHGGRVSKPPPHAAEGAWAAFEILGRLLQSAGETEETWACALWAIRTHHGPKTWDINPFSIRHERREYLKRITPDLLPSLSGEISDAWESLLWRAEGGEEAEWQDQLLRSDHVPLYSLLVYMLRRSDQLATSEVSRAVDYRPSPTRSVSPFS